MGQSLKAILQLILIIAVGLFVWGGTLRATQSWTVWASSGAVIAIVSFFLIRSAFRKETLPDLLRQVNRRYFERDGFCFSFVPTVVDGVCWMQIFFQNRYERMCAAHVLLLPPRKFIGRINVPKIDVNIECDRAAFGVLRVPWPIPANHQGRSLKFEVACGTHYPAGAGKLLRYREGLRAGTGGLSLGGVVTVSNPATVRFRLPTGVAESLPNGLHATATVLWRPPTGGFPVVPVDPSGSVN